MDFGIFSPKLGLRDDMPSVILSPAFLSKDTRNIHEHEGIYKKIPGRLPSFYDANGDKIACPKYVYAITAVSQGDKKFTISGNYASNFSGLTEIRIISSSDNDGLFTLSSVTDVAATTEIVVTEVIPDATADGNVFVDTTPIMKYHYHVRDSTSVGYLIVATAYHILLWNYTNRTLTVKFTCGTPGDVEHWSIDSLNDKIYATNNVELVQVYDIGTSPSGSFGDLESGDGLDIGGATYLTKAKYLKAYQGYLVLLATTEDSDYYPRRVRWCDASNTEEWDTTGNNDAGYRDCTETPGEGRGLDVFGNYLIVGKSDHIIIGQVVSTEEVFDWDVTSIKRGIVAEDAMLEIRDKFYYLSTDKRIYELRTERAIISHAAAILNTIADAYLDQAKALFVEQYNEVMFAVTTGTETGNDKIISFNIESEKYYIYNIPVYAFGYYVQQETYTYATLPYDTFAEWGVAWLFHYNTPLNQEGTPLDICSDSDGYTYELFRSNKDNGEDFECTLDISTSLVVSGLPGQYNRVNDRIEAWLNTKGEGSITLTAFLDGNRDSVGLGSASIVDSDKDWIVCTFNPDIRFRSAIIRLTSTAMVEWHGVIFRNYELDGWD